MESAKQVGVSRHRWLVGSLVFVAVVLALVAWSVVEARLLFVDRSIVTSPDLPTEFDGLRVAYLSDIHAGDLLGPARVRETVDRVNALNPDLVLLGGDYEGGGEGGRAMVYPELARLRAPLGVIAVLGNHESGVAGKAARAQLQEAGIILLENDHARVRYRGASLVVGGVEDAQTGRPDIAQAGRDVSPKSYAILLSHNPDPLPDGLSQAPGAFDLALAGHTHGGQVTLFGLWAPYVPSKYGQRFRGGWSTVDGVPALVSRGTGAYILPMRFFASPQLHLIELRQGRANVEP